MIIKKLLRSSSLAAAALMLMMPAGWGLSPTQTSAAASRLLPAEAAITACFSRSRNSIWRKARTRFILPIFSF